MKQYKSNELNYTNAEKKRRNRALKVNYISSKTDYLTVLFHRKSCSNDKNMNKNL